jgi:uncharacterized protein
MKAINEATGKNIADNLVVAGTLLARMKGLLGRNSLPSGEGLLIKSCMGIHTFGMKYPLDIVFLNRENRVVAVKRNMPPNRVTGLCFSASSVLELPVGTLDSSETSPGDTIVFT